MITSSYLNPNKKKLFKYACKFFTNKLNSNIELTKLSNGIRVITESSMCDYNAIGIYVDAGSRTQNDNILGVSHVFDKLTWKSTKKNSGPEIIEKLWLLGGNYMSSFQRETIFYQATTFNKDVENLFEIFSQVVRYPNFSDQEFFETLSSIKYELNELPKKQDLFLSENLHTTAYNNNTLGLPLYCPIDRIDVIKKNDIYDFHNKYFVPQNVVVSVIGMPHQHALKLVQQNFGDWKSDINKIPKKKNSNYTGGNKILPYQPPLSKNFPELYHIQIAFQTSGLLNDDFYSLALLQKILGGGSSFSAGGPGKGMFSRLYTNVLNQHPFIESCVCFNELYTDSGLFGILVSCFPNKSHLITEIVSVELLKLLEKKPENGGFTDEELRRAKNQLISALLMNVESILSRLEDMGRQIQYQGKITSTTDLITKIEKLTSQDLRNVLEKIFKGKIITKGVSTGLPTVIIQGDIDKFDDVNKTLKKFGLGNFNNLSIIRKSFNKFINYSS